MVGGVCSLVASSENAHEEEETILRVYEINNPNTNINDFCQGIIAKIDLEDVAVQKRIKYIMKFFNLSSQTSASYKFMPLRGTSTVFSIFPTNVPDQVIIMMCGKLLMLFK